MLPVQSEGASTLSRLPSRNQAVFAVTTVALGALRFYNPWAFAFVGLVGIPIQIMRFSGLIFNGEKSADDLKKWATSACLATSAFATVFTSFAMDPLYEAFKTLSQAPLPTKEMLELGQEALQWRQAMVDTLIDAINSLSTFHFIVGIGIPLAFALYKTADTLSQKEGWSEMKQLIQQRDHGVERQIGNGLPELRSWLSLRSTIPFLHRLCLAVAILNPEFFIESGIFKSPFLLDILNGCLKDKDKYFTTLLAQYDEDRRRFVGDEGLVDKWEILVKLFCQLPDENQKGFLPKMLERLERDGREAFVRRTSQACQTFYAEQREKFENEEPVLEQCRAKYEALKQLPDTELEQLVQESNELAKILEEHMKGRSMYVGSSVHKDLEEMNQDLRQGQTAKRIQSLSSTQQAQGEEVDLEEDASTALMTALGVGGKNAPIYQLFQDPNTLDSTLSDHGINTTGDLIEKVLGNDASILKDASRLLPVLKGYLKSKETLPPRTEQVSNKALQGVGMVFCGMMNGTIVLWKLIPVLIYPKEALCGLGSIALYRSVSLVKAVVDKLWTWFFDRQVLMWVSLMVPEVGMGVDRYNMNRALRFVGDFQGFVKNAFYYSWFLGKGNSFISMGVSHLKIFSALQTLGRMGLLWA